MAKYGKKIVEKIVGLVKSDTFTIAEICRQVGITPKTYHQWIDDYPDFAAAIEQAKDERMQFFVQEAKKSLLKKIQGYEVTETKVVTIPSKQKDEKGNPKPIIKEQTTTKKHIQADTAAIIDLISLFTNIFSKVAFSTFSIFPRRGRTACVLRFLAVLTVPPAESPSTM